MIVAYPRISIFINNTSSKTEVYNIQNRTATRLGTAINRIAGAETWFMDLVGAETVPKY